MTARVDPVAVLRARVAAAGTQQQFAQEHGVSAQHVSDILSGRRDPGPRVLAILGLTRVITYRRTPPCSTPL